MATPQPDSSDREAVVKYSDELYRAQKWPELVEYLKRAVATPPSDPELQWRLIRGSYRLGKDRLAAGDNKAAERVVDEAAEHAQKALAENEAHYYLQKWAGVLVGLTGDVKGTKVKIETSYTVRDHFKRAIEISPEEPDVQHLMGRWCYQVASVPWIQRRMASALLATPPTSSYEEALSYFDAAEKARPGFFKTNWLWLGKTYYQLSRRAEAKHWLQKIMDIVTEDIDDKEAQTEAEKLLKKV